MKINSMTTISKSITLKILRATNQVCQLKSNARCIYRQIAAQSVTQHEGSWVFPCILSLLLPATAVWKYAGCCWQIRAKGVTLLPPTWFGGKLLVPSTCGCAGLVAITQHPSAFVTHVHPNFSPHWQPAPAPQLMDEQPWRFKWVCSSTLKTQRLFFWVVQALSIVLLSCCTPSTHLLSCCIKASAGLRVTWIHR